MERFLQKEEAIGHLIFTKKTFLHFADNTLEKDWDNAIQNGQIRKLYADWYYDPQSHLMSPYVRDDFLEYLRPREFFYISFEYMLYKYGFLTDAITTLTVATTGKTEFLETSEGCIYFRHVEIDNIPDFEQKLLWDTNRRQYIATPEIAVMDSQKAKIDFPFNENHLAFVESGMPELYQVPQPVDYEIYNVLS